MEKACSATGILNATGLSTGVQYFIRVYSTSAVPTSLGRSDICVTEQIPPNDDCANATSIASATTCVAGASSLTGETLSGATVEGAGIATSCGGATTSQDVWYKFVAQSPSPVISLTNLGASWGASLRIQLLSGSCGSFTEIGCTNATSLTPSSPLIVGNTYYIRVLKNNTTAPTGASRMGF